MTTFDGMCALITGSASGLGAATAVALARGGARVIVNYQASAREAEETADLCRAANTSVRVVQADVAIDEVAAGWPPRHRNGAGSIYWSIMPAIERRRSGGRRQAARSREGRCAAARSLEARRHRRCRDLPRRACFAPHDWVDCSGRCGVSAAGVDRPLGRSTMSTTSGPANRAASTAKGCGRPAVARGLCMRHYQHLLKKKHVALAGEAPDFTGQDDPRETSRRPVFVRMPAVPSAGSYIGCTAYIAVPAF